jgi:hypothetical protein
MLDLARLLDDAERAVREEGGDTRDWFLECAADLEAAVVAQDEERADDLADQLVAWYTQRTADESESHASNACGLEDPQLTGREYQRRLRLSRRHADRLAASNSPFKMPLATMALKSSSMNPARVFSTSGSLSQVPASCGFAHQRCRRVSGLKP